MWSKTLSAINNIKNNEIYKRKSVKSSVFKWCDDIKLDNRLNISQTFNNNDSVKVKIDFNTLKEEIGSKSILPVDINSIDVSRKNSVEVDEHQIIKVLND